MIARMFGLVMFILPGTVVHAQSDSKPTSLSCEILRIDPDQFGWIERQAVSDDVYVMDDIETFFLFQSPNKPKSNPIDVRSGDAVALRDTYGSDQPCEFVCVTALNRGETVRLRLCTPTTSDLRLAAPVEVEIPLGGSTIVRLSNPAKEGRLTYLWIIAQSLDP